VAVGPGDNQDVKNYVDASRYLSLISILGAVVNPVMLSIGLACAIVSQYVPKAAEVALLGLAVFMWSAGTMSLFLLRVLQRPRYASYCAPRVLDDKRFRRRLFYLGAGGPAALIGLAVAFGLAH
jgi:hypothetical protein